MGIFGRRIAVTDPGSRRTTRPGFFILGLERYGSSVGTGWHGLLAPIFTEINLYNKENPYQEMAIDQIKEKYGTLRVYTTREPDYIQGMVSIAGKESAHICEECGARGKLVEIDWWWKTLCKRHVTAKKKSKYDSELFRKLYRAAADTYKQTHFEKIKEKKGGKK